MENERRVLDPVERVSEVVFGLIMVLTFTGSMSVATAGREDVREMLIGAIGCNLAWGIVDAVMFVLTTLVTRGRGLSLLRTVQDDTPQEAQRAIAGALPDALASIMRPPDYESLWRRLRALPAPPRHPALTRKDLRGAAEVFLLVFLSTFPVVLPFIVFREPIRALRTSNAIAVGMLFCGGVSLGRFSGLHPWVLALTLATVGGALVAITIALGG